MKIREINNKEDGLILLMIQERDKQIELLEEENKYIKSLLIELSIENTHLTKKLKLLRRKYKI